MEETEEVVEEVIMEGTSQVILPEVQVAAGEALVVAEIISTMEMVRYKSNYSSSLIRDSIKIIALG